jgi:hypothetical protein
MFKIIAVAVIGILLGFGFFDLGRVAYTLAALLLGIGALLDHSQRRTAAPGQQVGGSGDAPFGRGTCVGSARW